ncbi:SDR family NAD(P)-dependent oxidoreductase [Phycisphaera mikurensis]|uniref:Putative oxidoreductase n=1 Tax=Phycisphaera mikurensis (strain NBRC 102666 / KCTC 22515 / FYK2301M01) TaxID=1142394 RepID=I0IHC0_PHYMF|nr:SDR family NAD(P)-dependent oxidoreductase [Phycisphaera mikurensis]MBB6440907.1 NADP-dependent 3-hydroxy acid dehydrogenase YdfG [Phycisphaera mikurensis]BAM04658.1 putative oxidoreductase [Phycisphaera mikurensis NBRC 102666]
MSNETRAALVTGASAGIGRSTAIALAEAGMRVVVSARRAEALATLVEEIETAGGQADAVVADLATIGGVDAMWSEACGLLHGPPGVVIANAGHGLQGGVLSSDRSKWENMIALNYTGCVHLMRLAAGAQADAIEADDAPSGDVVVLGSVSGIHVSPFSGMYGSTKFAVTAAAEALRREVGPRRVRVSVIKPGIVRSEFQEVAGYDEETFGKAVAKFGDMLTPEDVARTIRFVVTQPPNVHVNDVVIRPVGQDYP